MARVDTKELRRLAANGWLEREEVDSLLDAYEAQEEAIRQLTAEIFRLARVVRELEEQK